MCALETHGLDDSPTKPTGMGVFAMLIADKMDRVNRELGLML
jgi:hypothetical protein